MAKSTGKTVGLIILVMLLLFLLFRITPFLLAPFGIFSGAFHTVKNVITDGIHVWNGHILGFSFSRAFAFIFFIIWIMVIIWVYRDAERRDMNGVLWALLVLIGNLIGLIIYLIIRSESVPKPIKPNNTLTCPKCKKTISNSFAFCPSCGKNIKNLCPECNSEIQTGWKVCPHCGTKLKKG